MNRIVESSRMMFTKAAGKRGARCGPRPAIGRGGGRALSRTTEDLELVLDEHGLGHHGTRRRDPGAERPLPAGAGEGQIAHHTIHSASGTANCFANLAVRHAQPVI
jgi:hypothetical protein